MPFVILLFIFNAINPIFYLMGFQRATRLDRKVTGGSQSQRKGSALDRHLTRKFCAA